MDQALTRLQALLADRYRLERELGAGGMATVYLALDLKHSRQVAIKVLRPGLAAALGPERFLREIGIAAKLHHPHILALYDSGSADGFLYYVMPYVEGESLRDRLAREKQIPLEDALRITREVADALSYAHSRDVVHRDIKPENILLSSAHAVVADFGIARAITAAGGDRLTETGLAIGTPAYMSPEQASGEANLDGRSDLYSLGTVLYEMLAGVPPFTGATAQAVLARKSVEAPPPLRSVRDTVTEPVERAVMTALARVPADRFATAAQFAEALQKPETHTARRSPRLRRAALLAIPVLVAALGVALLSRRGGRAAAPAYTILAEVEGTAPLETRRTVGSLLRAGLDQASVLVPLGRDEVQQGLRRMLRPESLPLDAATARELAYRGSVRTVVAASLDQVGRTFALTLRVLDSETGKVLTTETATSESEDGLIPAAGEAVRSAQRHLGARRAELRMARPLPDVTTASFDAYRKLARRGRSVEEIREALALDTSFAAAWSTLAVYWGNRGQRDSQLAAIAHLERHLDRVSEKEHMGFRSMIAFARSDHVAALELTDRNIRNYGPDPGRLTNRGVALHSLGRTEEAVQSQLEGIAISPFGPSAGRMNNVSQWLLVLGKPGEARRVVDSMRAACGSPCAGYLTDPEYQLQLAIALDEWDRADSLAALTKNPYALASLHARRGELRAAESGLDHAPPGNNLFWNNLLPELTGLLLDLVRGPPWTRRTPVAGHDALHELAWKGVWEALAGDSAFARRVGAGLRDSFPSRYRGAAPEFIEALVAARGERWRDVVKALGPVASTGETGRAPLDVWIHGLPIRWLVAMAYDRLGNLDSAAAMYERVLWPGGAFLEPQSLRGIPYSFAHQRLVVLYAKMGRLDDANRHYKLFVEAFTKPDPDLRYLLDEARAAIRR